MKKVKKSSQSQSHDFDLTWLYDLRNMSDLIQVTPQNSVWNFLSFETDI
jgi:hypothetical protein